MDIVRSFKIIRNVLAVYGAWCLISGVAEDQLGRVVDRITDRVIYYITGDKVDDTEVKSKKKSPVIIDAEFEEVKE